MRKVVILGISLLILWMGCAKKEEAKPPTAEEMKIIGTVSLIGAPSSEGVEVKIEALGISTTTDAKGAFVLSGLVEGVWEVSFSKPGYPPKKVEVRVEPGQKTVDIGKIEMEPGGRISGTITLEGAESFKGISVKLKSEDGTEISSTTTNDEGFFEIVDLPAGDYILAAEMTGYEGIEEPVTVEAGKKTELELSMKPLAGLGPEKGLIAYWSFDEGTGDLAKDYSGNKNDGKVIGAKWVKQKKGYALEFDGASSYVETPLVQLAEAGYTIEAWVKTTSDQGTIVQDRGTGPGLSITLSIGPCCNNAGKGNWCPSSTAGVPAVGVDSDNIWVGINAAMPINDGRWHHVVGVWVEGTTFKIYIDGRDASGPTASIGSPTPPYRGLEGTTIGGGHKPWSFFGLAGLIDEVRIYNRALSDKEIADHYSKMKGWFE
jgi:hypothetical protein